jgi:hypothetical protein
MSRRSLPYPIFDIDNHMYETEEALTKYLPKQHRGKIGYVEVNGRPKLVVKDQPHDSQPDVRAGGKAGQCRGLLPRQQIPMAWTSANSLARQWMSFPPSSRLRHGWN